MSALAATPTTIGAGHHVHVSPDGSTPCATLTCAQGAVRELLAAATAEAPLGDITVHVHGGRYEMREPLVFDERDHHPAPSTRRVSWVGPPKASAKKARVLCGAALSGWTRAWGGVYKVKLGRRVWNLAEGGRQSNPARHPNTNPGAGMGQLNGSSYRGASAGGFSWHEGALPANVSKFGLANTTVLMASGTNYYWTEAWSVASFNLTARTATFGIGCDAACRAAGDDSGPTVHAGPHFYVQGSVGLIDEPGEFAMDAAGEWLYYWPRSELPIEDLEIVAPISRRPVQIVGRSHDTPVRGLTFRGLEFVASDQDPEGVWYLFNPLRSNSVPKRFQMGLIFTENATDVVIEHCKISAAGNAAIWLNTASSHVTVRGNWIEDAAFCGVYAMGWWVGDAGSYYKGAATTAADTYVNHHHTITDNVIHNVGRFNAGAAGVWLDASGENLVSRNYINRSPRNGVGTFGVHFDTIVAEHPHGVYEFKGEDALTFETQFELCHAKNNTISYNEMSNIVRDSCDPGGIESYGLGKGHNVSYNAVHDVTQPPVLFRDDSSSSRSQQVISLLFSDAQTHFSEYKGNVMFEANACAGDGAMIKNAGTNFENNIVADSSLPNSAWIGSYSGPVFGMTFSRNVHWNTTGYCNGGGWPSEQPASATPIDPSSPIGMGSSFHSNNYELDNGFTCGFRGACGADKSGPMWSFYNRTGVGIGGVFVNASGTCYHTDHTDANNTKNYGCNSYPNCNWRGHFSNYHLTTAQMESPVVSMIDYELHQAPINPSMTKALKLTNKPPWNEHSVRATKEPFARKNEPWNSNFSDFVASSDEARKVGHVPLPVHQIGLGSFFDRGFDRRLVGRRNLFREGGASLGGASPPKVHFEDMDRVRGLTVSASLGLIATAEFHMGATTWAKWRHVVFNAPQLRSGSGRNVSVLVRAQTNAKGGCGTVPHPFPPPPPPVTAPPPQLARTRRNRVNVFEHEPDESESAFSAPPTCGTWLKNQTSLKGGHFKALTQVADFGACCAACKATPPCQFFTWTIGNGACYLNKEQGPLSKCPGQCTTGGLQSPHPPPPPPPPFPSPLRLSFSLNAPLPMGGASATVLGSLELSDGGLVPSGGAESGVFGVTGSGPWCDFEGQLALPPSVAGGGGAHDLYVSMFSASNHSEQRFALDYFSLHT